MSKEQTIKATSPIGNANWFKILKPDPKYNKYSVDLIVEDSEKIQQLLNNIEEMTAARIADAKKEAKTPMAAAKIKDSGNRPVEAQLDSEGKPTGKYVLKFRMASSGKKRDDSIYTVAAPAVFNSKGEPLSTSDKNSLSVPNGSLIQVSYELSSYLVGGTSAGVSMKPRAVKLHKLQSVADASQFGFDQSEFNSQDDGEDEVFSNTNTANTEENDF